MKRNKFSVAAFYKFTPLTQLEVLQVDLLNYLKNLNIKGTVLIAGEGINGTVSGSPESIEDFKVFLANNNLLSEKDFKISYSDFLPFPRLKVKLKDEIVTIGDTSVNPQQNVGTYVDPEDWNEFISQEDVLVLDTRNTYEVSIGSFKGAIQPDTTNFREFPKWVEEKANISKDTKIAMFCTGGIRCEKASSFLIEKGYSNVSHLQGGILNYLESIDEKSSLWSGECFVFDDRVALNHQLDKGSYDLCHGCRMPITDDDKDSLKYVRGVSCPNCHDHKSEDQKKRYADRQKQMDLARQRNKKHIGPKDEVRQK
jgi:UPF0176 protein